jgi:hypothetical protein
MEEIIHLARQFGFSLRYYRRKHAVANATFLNLRIVCNECDDDLRHPEISGLGAPVIHVETVCTIGIIQFIVTYLV